MDKKDPLFLVENDFQVEDLLRRFPSETPEWVALGPYAQSALKARGLAHRIPEDFHDQKEISDFCHTTHPRLRKLCDRLDERLIVERPELKKNNVSPFLFHIFPLTLLFDALGSRVLQLRRLLDAYPGRTARLYKTPKDDSPLFQDGFSNRESLWGYVASLKGWGRDFDFVSSPLLQGEKPPSSFKTIVRNASDGSVWTQSLVLSLREKTYGNLPGVLAPGGRPSLLTLGNRVEWRETWPFLREDGWRIFYGSERSLAGPIENRAASRDFEDFLESNPEVRGTFRNGDVDFFPLLKDRLLRIAGRVPGDYERALKSLKRLRDRRGLKGVLTSSAASGRHHVILHAAQTLGIPVFLWQHGFVVHDDRINQLYDYSDRMTANTTLVYGEGAREAYEKYGEPFPSRLVSIGSAQLEKLLPAKTISPKKILYATTNYYLNYWYFGMEPGWSDNLFYRDQMTILNRLSRLRDEKGAEIVVKLHPSEDFPPPPWAEEIKKRPGWTVVAREATFTDLVREAGTVILDIPSTTLLQSIAMGSALFSLMRHWTFHPDVLRLLKKRAVCESSADDLMNRVSEFVDSDRYAADRGDKGFLRRFGSCNDSQAAAVKAREILRSLR